MFCIRRFRFANVALCVIVALVQLPACHDAARILGFFPVPSKSNMLIHCAIAETLSQVGHDVTVLGNIPNVYPNASYKYIHVEVASVDAQFVTETVNQPQPFYKRFNALTSQVTQLNDAVMSHPTTQQFLRTNGAHSFDLVILGYFLNDFLLGLAAHFCCPLVVSFTVQPIFVINQMVGNPSEHSYVPTLFSGLRQPLHFWARVKNALFGAVEEHGLANILRWHAGTLYARHFPAPRYPPLDAAAKNVSLVFVNHHFNQGPIRPMVPNLIEIGGIQINELPAPLPADLEKVFQFATHGVILFSLGSAVQGANLSPEKAKAMFNVLSKLPYRVLWKWGDTAVPGKAPNIIYRSWLPQGDILAQPNLKLFITHGGMGSVVEAQYHGVPMIGIPLFGDQPANMANVVRAGFGVSVDYATLTEASFGQAIREVLDNTSYKEAVHTFATLYRDRPLTPRELVVYWVDYVLRYDGAWHLQSPALHMNLWQLMSLDVIALLLAISTAVLLVLVQICRYLCCRRRTLREEKLKKNAAKTKKNK